ncbi:TPA: hypothetical protein ACWV6T_006144, partial [Salmonella enterica subsp. enterica serovar Muenchen]
YFCPPLIFEPAKVHKILGGFPFLVPVKLSKTSSVPPYGVASHQNFLDAQQSSTDWRNYQECDPIT